jgi:hypothetical protein
MSESTSSAPAGTATGAPPGAPPGTPPGGPPGTPQGDPRLVSRARVPPAPRSADASDAPLTIGQAAKQLSRQRREARGVAEGGTPGAGGNGHAAPRTPQTARQPAPGPLTAPAGTPPAGTRTAEGDGEGTGGVDQLFQQLGANLFGERPAGDGEGGTPRTEGGTPDAAPTTGGVELEVAGQIRMFTHAELRDAVMKSRGFTQKTQELANLTRQVNEQYAAIQQILPIMVPELQRQVKALETSLGDEPDWGALEAAGDPKEYQRQDAAWKRLQAERARLARLEATQQQETAEQERRRLSDGHRELVRVIPGWGDARTRESMQREIATYARGLGYSNAELNGIFEPRHVITLLHATVARRLFETMNTRGVVPLNVGRGGAPTEQRRQPGGTPDAEAAFAARPSVRNAAAVLAARRAKPGAPLTRGAR